ncbi:MAG: Wzz/FepE/Etk N-terminal domain-containing protein [Blautia sp.]|nr:Wzz/FepE/Etk N-terminal domain-containing protein [Blautia sp.]MDY3999071.1 Wzz/FepE/Etk N-terminal domain-containing protein [Blautia sp.]
MENQHTTKNDEMEIDLMEIAGVILSKLWIIILSGITAALVFIVVTMLFITPQYESTTKMYVLSQQDNNTLTSSDMQTSLSLTKDYAELIKSRTVTEGVIAQLNLDMTDKQLLQKISVGTSSDTRILSITVTDEDPYQACQIANAVRDVAANHIQNVMNIDAVNIVETANIPNEKASPSLSKNAVMGGLLGVILATAIILLVYLTNDTIKSQEDVEKYLQLSVLGTIPLMEMEKKSRKQKKGKGRKKR